MAGSADEREIRDAVVARLRILRPAARIVHELNTAGHGSCRIDVAAISPQDIVAVEIKSKKDTLDRLQDQWDAFSRCCHHVIVAAHQKHFVDEVYDHPRSADYPPDRVLNHPVFVDERGRARWSRKKNCWPYPEPERNRWGDGPWRIDPRDVNLRRQPRAMAILDLLWAEELRAECARHKLNANRRQTREAMMLDMAWHMTGREIVEAVCRQLRARSFPEADAPVLEAATAAAPEVREALL